MRAFGTGVLAVFAAIIALTSFSLGLAAWKIYAPALAAIALGAAAYGFWKKPLS